MRSEQQIFGDLGEACAMLYLRKHKYKLLDCNYVCEHGEVDIVARKGKLYVFVEVKTRSSDFMRPSETLDREKQRKIYYSAKEFLKEHRIKDVNFRFDIIEVMGTSPKDFKVNHLENAF